MAARRFPGGHAGAGGAGGSQAGRSHDFRPGPDGGALRLAGPRDGGPVLHLSAELVARHLDRRALIDALARAFRQTDTQVPPREHHSFGDEDGARTLLIMPAWRPDRAVGIKLVTVTAENSRRGLPGVQASY